MNKIPFSRSKAKESQGDYWNQINNFLALSDRTNLSENILPFYYLYWIYSETASGQLLEFFERNLDWDQDQVLEAIKRLGHKVYADNFEVAKLAYEEVLRLSENFDENEEEIFALEDEIFARGAIYEAKPDALAFIETMIRNNEDNYLEFID